METLKRPLNYYWYLCPCKCSIVSYELQKTLVSLSTHEVCHLLTCIGYLYSDSSTSCLIRALVPYHSHLLLLLNHVVIVVKLCCV